MGTMMKKVRWLVRAAWPEHLRVALPWLGAATLVGTSFGWALAAEEGKADRGAPATNAERAPEVHTVSSRLERVVVVRLRRGMDLVEGLERAAKREGIKKGILLSCVGSLTSYHVHTVANTELPPKNVFAKAEGPYDLLGVTGYIIDGRVHAHLTIVDDKQAFGGHLERGTTAFTFAVVTIGVLADDAPLAGLDDWRWN